VATDQLQDMVRTNFDFYKRFTDDEAFGRLFPTVMFERFRGRLGGASPESGNHAVRGLP
jgi:hypothetical protein